MKFRSLFLKPTTVVAVTLAIALAVGSGAGFLPMQRASAATVATTGTGTRVRLASPSATLVVQEKTSSIESTPEVVATATMKIAAKTATTATKAQRTAAFKKAEAARRAAAARKASAASAASTGWKSAKVSWYGPGFYGHTMAGGGTLTPSSMVVAHRTLRFGTKVQITYKGKTVTAVVRDRGPYVSGRTFDLGPGTAHALGFSGVGTIQWRIVK